MLATPTIDLAGGQPPTLQQVRRTSRRLLLAIAGSFAVVAYLVSSALIALGEAHMSTRAADLGTTGPQGYAADALQIAIVLVAAYLLYRSLMGYLDLCICEDSKVCRVVYAVCRANPQADRYRQAVVRQARGFLTAEIDAFYALSSPEVWARSWPEDLRDQVRSPSPLAGGAA